MLEFHGKFYIFDSQEEVLVSKMQGDAQLDARHEAARGSAVG